MVYQGLLLCVLLGVSNAALAEKHQLDTACDGAGCETRMSFHAQRQVLKAHFCRFNPEQCTEQAKDRRAELLETRRRMCRQNPMACELLEQRRQKMVKRCGDDPQWCNSMSHLWEERRQAMKQRIAACRHNPSLCPTEEGLTTISPWENVPTSGRALHSVN